jgi:agmatine deiminase
VNAGAISNRHTVTHEPSPDSPASLGYRLPAEWEPHAGTWLAWPHKLETWPGKFAPIPDVWTELVATLARHEPVHVLAGGAEVLGQARTRVGQLPGVTLHAIETNDVWARDYGPMFLAGPGLPPALVDWEYNAWGGKYPPFDLDNRVPEQVAQWTGRRRFVPGIILEGGSIDGDGQGTLLTTEQCLLNPNRNPDLGRAEVERYLADYCGAQKVLWLGRGIEGDDTDGHIDELARFVAPGVVVAAVEADPRDPNHEPLAENLARLKGMTDARGRRLEVVELPMPGPLYHAGQRLPASYLNFYLANGSAVVPVFGDPADAVVLATLGRLLSGRRIYGIGAVDLFWGLGAFHCITQQEPAAEAAAG